MDIKSFRKVLATTTLASMLMVPVSYVAFADETENLDAQIQQTEINSLTEVIMAEEVVGTYVQKLPKGNNANLGTFDNLDALTDVIVQMNKAFESSISFTYTGSLEDIRNGLSTALKNELSKAGNDYVNGTLSSWKYSYTSAGKVSMSFTYLGTHEQEEYVTEQVKLIAASLVKPNMSESEKVRAVNDYVVTHSVYSQTTKTTPHHIYTYLKEGKAVCQAYALLTYRLLTEMGFEARYVVGEAGEPHAWNSVKINGTWFHLDTTWNDSSFNGYDSISNTGYRYLFVTSETLRQDHTWDEEAYPEATDNSYSYLHNVFMGIEHNGEIYYSDATNYTLHKLNLDSGTRTQLLNHRAFYIAAYNDFIYFSDYSNGGYLTSYNLNTGETKVIDQSVVMQLQVVDEYLNYKIGSKVKTYELPLTENQQKVKAVKNAIKALTPTSKTYLADIQKAAELYNTLDADLQADVSNYATLQAIESETGTAKNEVAASDALDSSSTEAITEARTTYYSKKFADFDAKAWWAADMIWAIDRGLISGYGDVWNAKTKKYETQLQPNTQLTEAHFLTIFFRYAQPKELAGVKNTTTWNNSGLYNMASKYKMPVLASGASAYSRGLADKGIRRGKLAQLMVSYYSGKSVSETKAIQFFIDNGITAATSIPAYNQDQILTRSEISAFIQRYESFVSNPK